MRVSQVCRELQAHVKKLKKRCNTTQLHCKRRDISAI